MRVTLLGTGSPVPLVERGGTALLVEVADRELLVDCGPKTVHRMLENGFDVSDVETLLFSHQHVDHNADFFNFVISSWSMGRDALTIYGPEGTERLLDALYSIYEEDLAYRKRMDYPTSGIDDIDCAVVEEGVVLEDDGLRITAMPVEHSIETYAYRFEETATGDTLVFSGDTRQISRLADFASGADVLIQDGCLAPSHGEPPEDGFVWEPMTHDPPQEMWDTLHETHCTPAEAGEIAADADVETVVLTHILPYRDPDELAASAASTFDGDVRVAHDGTSIDV